MAESFGDRLRRTREEAGLSQAMLGRRLGIGRAAVSHIESGQRRQKDADFLRQLALALKVSADWLVGLTEEREQKERENDAEGVCRQRRRDHDGSS